MDAIAIVGVGCRLPGGGTAPTRSGNFYATGSTRSVRCQRTAGTTTRSSTPTREGRGRSTRTGADSWRTSTSSMPTSSASPRAKRPPWTLSIACCSRWPGRCWRTPVRSWNSWPAHAPAFSSGSRRTTTRSSWGSRRSVRPRTRIKHSAARLALQPTASRMRSTCKGQAWPSTPPAPRRSRRCTWPARAFGGGVSPALVGGVNAILRPETTMSFCYASMLSRDGRCKSFDARADGYGRAEGAAVVVLKPLSRAICDGDRVYAVILGTAVNQDGHTSGITVPSGAT